MSQRKERKVERDGESKKNLLVAKTDAQKRYIAAIKSNDLTFGTGPAGTGKTYIAASMASDMMRAGQIDQVILCRPAVEAGEKLGFLPGTVEEKMAPWTAPFTEVLKERLGAGTYDKLVKSGAIRIAPFSYMRGLTFKNAFVILDEAQNTTREQMKMFLTRLGENVKVVIDGDTRQSDIGKQSGLSVAIGLAQTRGIKCGLVEFTKADVVRSKLCQEWVEAFEAD